MSQVRAAIQSLLVLSIAGAGLLACGSNDDADFGPLAVYAGERSGDDGDLHGTLTIDGPCVYLETLGGVRLLLAFPKESTSWDEQRQSIRFDGQELREGQQIVVGGGGVGSNEPEWLIPPHDECSLEDIWSVG